MSAISQAIYTTLDVKQLGTIIGIIILEKNKSYVFFTYPIFTSSRGEIPTGEDILQQEDIVKLKRCIFSAQVSAMSVLTSFLVSPAYMSDT